MGQGKGQVDARQKISIGGGLERDFVQTFNLLMQVAYDINESHGWHDPMPTDGECVALVHSEASEILEWLRHGNPKDDKIPEFSGAEAEGADVVIRLMSWYKRKGWNLPGAIIAKLMFNSRRPYRHGGKAL